jgi:hypothetical protein
MNRGRPVGGSQTRISGLGGGRPALAGAFVAAVALGVTMLPEAREAVAQAPDLAGSWSGGGTVTFPSGSSERARCRATYSRSGGSSYELWARCATPSASVEQSATVRKVGANAYSGSFYNSDYGISGSIYITVSGNSQSVSLSGGGASASLRLSR